MPRFNLLPAPKINIPADKIRTLTGQPTAAASFDGNTSTAWFAGWAGDSYPARCLIDLGKSHNVERIRVFDGTGITRFRAYASNAVGTLLQKVLDFELGLYQTWQDHAIPPTVARFWVFEIAEKVGDSPAPEIELYGEALGEDPVDPPPPLADKRTDAQKIGANGFPWVPFDKFKIPFIRTYISAGWIFQPNGLYVEPFWQASTVAAYGLDTYLRNAKAAGTKINLCVNQTPEWYRPTGRDDGANDYPFMKPAANRTNPASYKDAAGFFFQLAARYGRKTWPENALRLAHGPVKGSDWTPANNNPALSGADLLEWIEPGNEVDKWWKRGSAEGEQYMEPEEHAAYLSAVVDGHEGRLGAGYGIKTGDPTMQVSMPGLTGFDLPYLRRMDDWFKANRTSQRWPCDAIQVHHYSNRGNKAGVWPPTWYGGGAVPPELDEDFATAGAVVKFAHDRGLLCLVGEFGYDTQATPSGQNLSWQYPMPVTGKTALQIQADWLTRTYLEYLRYGVDQMFMFNGVDEASYVGGGLYQSSGLLSSENTGHQPKPSYTTVMGLVAALGGFKYSADRSTPTVRVLEFMAIKGGDARYFYWSPTAGARTVPASIAGLPVTATEAVQYVDVKFNPERLQKDPMGELVAALR